MVSRISDTERILDTLCPELSVPKQALCGQEVSRQSRDLMFFACTCDLGIEARSQVLYRMVLPKKKHSVLYYRLTAKPKIGRQGGCGSAIFLRTDLGFGLLKASSLQNRWLQPQTLAGSTVKGIASPHPFAC